MRLLVSVRSAAEVGPSLAGGADIIDAKEPGRGALGPVDSGTLAAIAAATPAGVPLSAALGDPSSPEAVTVQIRNVAAVLGARAEAFVKLGLGGVPESNAEPLLTAAVRAAADEGLQLVAVAYADSTQGLPVMERVARLAARTGADGVLVDTQGKEGGDLLDHIEHDSLRSWAEEARAAGLLVAVAGSLSAATIAGLVGVPADVLGVRGAVCTGGRNGTVDEALVRRLRRALDREWSPLDGAKR